MRAMLMMFHLIGVNSPKISQMDIAQNTTNVAKFEGEYDRQMLYLTDFLYVVDLFTWEYAGIELFDQQTSAVSLYTFFIYNF